MTAVDNNSKMSGELVYSCCAPFVDGYSLCYELYRRKNIDSDVDAVWLYDLYISKRDGSELLDRVVLRAVGSVYYDAVRMCDTALGWSVSCISAYDFYEEYITR